MKVKKIEKEDIGAFILLVIMVAFLLWIGLNATPKNVIKNCLQSEFNLTAQSVELESMGKSTYKLLNAPTDPATGIKLENWEIVSFGTTGAVTFANSLDLPKMATFSIRVEMSEDEQNRLEELALKSGLSLDELVEQMLLQKLAN